MEILLNCWTINYVVAVGCLAGRMVVFSFISSLHSLCLQCVQYHTRFVRINVYTKCISLFYSSTLVVAAAAASKSAWDSLVEFLPSFDAIFEISNTPYAVSQSVTKSDDDDNYNDDVWLIWPKKRPRKRHQIIINLLEIIFFLLLFWFWVFFCSPQFIVCRVVIHIYLSKWTHVQFQRLWRLFVVGCWLVGLSISMRAVPVKNMRKIDLSIEWNNYTNVFVFSKPTIRAAASTTTRGTNTIWTSHCPHAENSLHIHSSHRVHNIWRAAHMKCMTVILWS